MAMEAALGGFVGDEWDALCKMFTNEDADLLMQLHADHNNLPSNECNIATSCFTNDQSYFFPINEGGDQNAGSQCFDVLEYLNFHNLPQENGNSSENSPDSSKLLEEPNHGIMDDQNAKLFSAFLDGGMIISQRQEVDIDDSGNEHLLKRKLDSPHVNTIEACLENPPKKPRVTRNAKKTSKRKVQSKPKKSTIKGKQVIRSLHEEEANAGDQISSNYCSSEDDSYNASQESNIGGGGTSDVSKLEPAAALNLNGKSRASRGSATDPQSLYARRRRERINERLRILQNLIPNGTKVDISTMLEDAVQYVKFLQVQIKLLCSDDLWMYAPIIHNGVDVGMYNKIFQTL